MIIWKVEKRNIDDLIGYDKNPRKFTEKGLKDLKKSLLNCGDANIITINADNTVLGGHARLTVMKQLDYKEVDVKVPDRQLTEPEVKEIVIRLNANTAGEWDLEKLEADFELDDLIDWGLDVEFGSEEEDQNEDDNIEKLNLKQKYIEAPFSVLNTRTGEWQNRKKQWECLGIKSELGRNDKLLFNSLSGSVPDYYVQKSKIEKKIGRKLDCKEFEEKYLDKSNILSQTSIFDPVLCEIAYSWFSKENDLIIDPFAGGSVRGIVASELKRNYTGLELRAEQVEANINNANEICDDFVPKWIIGDSNKTLDDLENNKFNMCLSCPPYADLEVYSDDPDDLSNMEYNDFLNIYGSIINKLYDKLQNNSFVVWVIGEVRNKKGNYYNFLGDTIKCFLNAGFNYYNEIILLNTVGTGAIRCQGAFNSSRKVCKVHQNVLVFVKGDAKEATKRIGSVQIKDIEEEPLNEQL